MRKIISALLITLMMMCSLYMFASAEDSTDIPTEPPITEAPTEIVQTEEKTYTQIIETEAVEPETQKTPTTYYGPDDDDNDNDSNNVTEKNNDNNNQYTDNNNGNENNYTEQQNDEEYSKTTRSMPSTTETTKPTTVKKNITDFGERYTLAKWVALAVMILSAAALIIINVRHHNIKKKQQLRTALRPRSSAQPQRTRKRANPSDKNKK